MTRATTLQRLPTTALPTSLRIGFWLSKRDNSEGVQSAHQTQQKRWCITVSVKYVSVTQLGRSSVVDCVAIVAGCYFLVHWQFCWRAPTKRQLSRNRYRSFQYLRWERAVRDTHSLKFSLLSGSSFVNRRVLNGPTKPPNQHPLFVLPRARFCWKISQVLPSLLFISSSWLQYSTPEPKDPVGSSELIL